jgi:hypothetical protein
MIATSDIDAACCTPKPKSSTIDTDWEYDDCGGGFYDTNHGEIIEDIDEQPTWDCPDEDL